MSKCECDKEPVLVMPKASAESITIYESDGVAAAQAELAKLILTAVDTALNVIVVTIENNPFVWAIDLANKTATYEFNNSDLPIGYTFDPIDRMVDVTIERIPDLPTGFIDPIDNDQSQMTNKVLREGQIFILRDGRVYTVMGQPVK